jgi:glycosyltransferase involved in cell wall biosynthesis
MSLNIINAVVADAHGGMYHMAKQYSDVLKSLGHNVINIGVGVNQSRDKFDQTIKNSGHYDLLAKFRAGRLIKKTQADVVFCHCSRSVAVFALHKKKVLVIAVPHTLNIVRFLKADHFIAISGKVREILLGSDVSEANIALIHNAVKLGALSLKNTEKNTCIRFGFLGRLDANKNTGFLLKVIASLKERGCKAKFIVGGTGSTENELKAMAQTLNINDSVSFKWWIKKEDFFSQIDCMLFPSLNEVMPLTIIEAFGYGIPVITHRFNGFSYPFTSKNLFIVENLLIDQWVDTCMKISEDFSCSESIVRDAKDTYIKKFSESVMEDMLASSLERMLMDSKCS